MHQQQIDAFIGMLLGQTRQILTKQGEPPLRTLLEIINLVLGGYASVLTVQLLPGPTVQHGPFAGMRYVGEAVCGSLLPKLLGCYEAELHQVLTAAIARGYSRVINIGCGEGYYAVGMAMRLPNTRVFAFDTAPKAQQLCRQLAEMNGVGERVEVAGECRHEDLERVVGADTLVLCDIEGGEFALLDPALSPRLRHCDLLVELHEFLDPAMPRVVLNRFQESHTIELISQATFNAYCLPELRSLSQFQQFVATGECRQGLTPWAMLRARNGAG